MTEGRGEGRSEGRGGKAKTWNGRYVNIAHRRSASELTPLIQQNLALQQQVELLTAQNQHMMHQHMGTAQSPHGRPPHQDVPTNFSNTLLPPPPQVFGHQRGGSGSNLSGNASHSRQRSMGHVRRHSLAVSEAKRAAHERVGENLGSSPSSQHVSPPAAGSPGPMEFRFPPSPDRARRGNHSRSQSMNTPYRRQSPQSFQFPPEPTHQPQHSIGGGGHHRQGSSFSGNFGGGGGGSLSGSQGHHGAQSGFGHKSRPSIANDFSPNQQNRKSLFVPYLPQSAIPEMLSEGLLVTGTLRVNHKNRSYAYVSTDLLDAEVFIAGSKDRNRALEGDLVAVELLDVDDVWDQKREKEERKKRRDADSSDGRLVETQEGQLRRRGSLRQREPQKRSDDVEVEGQTLLLREELGGGDEKPLYSGHVVAILERPAGQLFSGTLGLLRPSSQANKDRHSRTTSTSSFSESTNIEKPSENRPKIVWFKPVDKCVPLMAIPTEQAPADLVDNPQAYANQVFVAQIKRWPITSLHPFGMLVEKLGSFGDYSVSQMAILREFNFGPHKFSDAAVQNSLETGQAMERAALKIPQSPVDVSILTPDMAVSTFEADGEVVLAAHILDIVPFIERGGALDRELRHKSASVYMNGLSSPLIPSQEAQEAVQFAVGRRSPTLTVEFHLESGAVTVTRQSVTPSESAIADDDGFVDVIVSKFEDSVQVLRRKRGLGSFDDKALDLSSLLDVVVPARPPLSEPSRSEQIVNEIMHAVNAGIASELLRSTTIGLNTLVRRQSEPLLTRLEQFTELLNLQGIRVDTTSAHTLSRSLASQLTPRQAEAIKAPLAKILGRQRYAVAQRTNPGQLGHYWFGFDAYTHFSRPLLRYSDHIVARQVHAMLEALNPTTPISASPNLEGGPGGFATPGATTATTTTTTTTTATTAASSSNANLSAPGAPMLGSPVSVESSDSFEDASGAQALAPELSFRYDWARSAQEQSFHLSLSQKLSNSFQLFSGVVTAVYESAFDVVIPELSVEKRVHGDQLPLVRAEFHPGTQLLELFWKPSSSSSALATENTEITATSATPGLTVSTHSEDAANSPPVSVTDEMRSKLTLRPEEHAQEIRPLTEVPVLMRVVSQERVLPSIVIVAACPF